MKGNYYIIIEKDISSFKDVERENTLESLFQFFGQVSCHARPFWLLSLGKKAFFFPWMRTQKKKETKKKKVWQKENKKIVERKIETWKRV